MSKFSNNNSILILSLVTCLFLLQSKSVYTKSVQPNNLQMDYQRIADSVYQECALLELNGKWGEAISLLEDYIKKMRLAKYNRGRAKLQSLLGGIIWKQGHHKKAMKLLKDSHEISRSLMDYKTLGETLYNLGEIYYIKRFVMREDVGGKDTSYHFESLNVRRNIDDLEGVTHSLSRIGVIYERVKDYQKALEYYNQALEICKTINYKRGMTRPFTHIGAYHRREGNLEEALKFHEKALSINEEIGNAESLVFNNGNVGNAIYSVSKDFDSALEHYKKALKYAKQIDFKLAIWRTLLLLGSLYEKQEMFDQAKDYYQQSIESVDGLGYNALTTVSNNAVESLEKKSDN